MTAVRQLITTVLIVFCLLSGGCIAIPAGTEVLSTEEVSRETITDTKLIAAHLEAELTDQGGEPVLLVTAIGDYEETSFDRVTREIELGQRKLVIGLFPGWGAHNAAGERWNGAPLFPYRFEDEMQEIGRLTVLLPLANVVLLGAPTWATWFTEAKAEWETPSGALAGDWRDEIGQLSLVGWFKTRKNGVVREETADETTAKQQFSQAIAGLTVTLTDQERGFSEAGKTDDSGSARFAAAQFRYVTMQDITFQASAHGAKGAIEPITVDIPSSTLGSDLGRTLWHDLAAYEFDTIYADEGNIDFTKRTETGAPYLKTEAKLLGQPDDQPEVLLLEVTVANAGRGTAYRLIARTASRDPAFDGHLLVFGKLEPGTSVTRTLQLPVSEMDLGEAQRVEVQFKELHRYEPQAVALSVDPAQLVLPRLAFTYEVVDDPARSPKTTGNADGVIQKGEAFDLLVTVKNTGRATAEAAEVSLQVPADPSVTLLDAARQPLGDLAPGESASARFNVAVRSWSELRGLAARLRVSEESFGARRDRPIELPFETAIAEQPMVVDRTYWVAAGETVLRTGASREASEFARAPRGTRLHAVGELPPDWVQVELSVDEEDGPQRQRAWVARADLDTDGPAGTAGGTAIVVTRFEAPAPSVFFLEPASEVVETRGRHLDLRVSVVQPGGKLRDVRVSVGPDEQHLREAEVAKTPQPASGSPESSLLIECRAALSFGPNLVRVVATNEDGKTTTRNLSVRRSLALDRASYALAIGIEDYLFEGDVPGCREDARSVAEAVREAMRIPEDNVVLLTDDSSGINNPLHNVLKRRIEGAANDVGEDGVVFVYFSGHGVTRNGQFCLIPRDCTEQDAVPLHEILEPLDRSSARQAVVVVDACRATAEEKGVAGIAPDLVRAGPQTAVFLSCGRGEKSYPAEDGRSSVYTRAFVESLRELASDADRAITAQALQELIERKMRAWRRQSGMMQTPQLILGDKEDAVIVPGPKH